MPTREEVMKLGRAYQDSNLKLTDQSLKDTKPGIRVERDLPRMDSDDETGSKLDMILKHLDSLHGAIQDSNTRLDALEGKSRKDSDDDDDDRQSQEDKNLETENEKEEGEPTPLAADSAYRSRRDAMYSPNEPVSQRDAEKAIEKHDSLRAAAAHFQSRVDRVMQMQSALDSAPRWLNGESLIGYKQRVLAPLKKYSSAWKKTNLYAVKDSGVLDIAAQAILDDAERHFKSPDSVKPGHLREVITRDSAGREHHNFYGDPETTWSPFKQIPRRLVGFNLKPTE